ncbi:YIP1 family protein [Yinghuangia sp. ASG 101]|uniref:Yip1 family protein n=1 Tax=Yinghuangia sp. ASG 101 TaxID=2896848 RepID=UPI001E5A7866|nr:Yip1 family protein [Yinghuangia sp. ASG 101]UGQ15114.1 YIP1 family protein [Yinghuangia sp. ASG 101]
MTGNDRYPYDPYGSAHEPPVQYDQYGRPLPQGPQAHPQAPHQQHQQHQQHQAPRTHQAPQPHDAPRPPSHRHHPGQQGQSPPRYQQQPPPPAQPSAYPAGPLALPDETSIYVYGGTPDGYTQVTPAVPEPAPRRRAADAGRGYPGQPYTPVATARPLVWQEVLSGLATRPLATLERARDQAFWWPALIVSAICGVLAMIANDTARDQVLSTTLSTSVPAILLSAVLVPAFCVVLGWVSTMLARSLGGNGDAGPFITLAALVTWLADAPRLLVSLFAHDDNSALFTLGLATFALTAWLLTAAAMRVHELPWPRALGAVSVQLIALLVSLKLPVTG